LVVERNKKLKLIGNVIGPNVPVFKDEEKNEVVKSWGEKPAIEVDGKTLGKLHHNEVMNLLDILEMERGQKVAGHRGYYLKGFGVLLNQALIQLGLSTLMKEDFTALQPPYFIKSEIMHETCQLDDFSENLYQVEGTDENKNSMYLIATSEQPISAMHRGEFIEPQDLPYRYAGYSTCFRKEAGSHGRDLWGIFRIHQFEKVEQFVFCHPDNSWEELDKMIATSEKFYQALNLHYQVIKIVSGALNDAAAQKYDLEAWFPGYGNFRELVSCSNCTDYQSRALNVRMAVKNLPKGESMPFVHMLNGTMCATERTLCCLMENYQTEEGLNVPEALQPFMGGVKFIPFSEKKIKAWRKQMEEDEKKSAEKAAKEAKKKGGKKKDGPKEEEKKEEEKKE
jgi:seryl-tRNA synthetase